MQQRVYIVQTPVRDTTCDQRLKAAPHWHMASISQNIIDEAVGPWRKRLRVKAVHTPHDVDVIRRTTSDNDAVII